MGTSSSCFLPFTRKVIFLFMISLSLWSVPESIRDDKLPPRTVSYKKIWAEVQEEKRKKFNLWLGLFS